MALEMRNQEALEDFLADEPLEWSRLIAARAALRVVPFAIHRLRERRWLPVLRACFISWAAGKFPTHDMNQDALSATTAASDAASTANSGAANSSAVRAALSAADSALSIAISTHQVFKTAARSAANSAISCGSDGWKAINVDVRQLNDGRYGRLFSGLMSRPLWLEEIPSSIEEAWQSVVAENRTSHYAPWIDWYNAVLNGNDYFGPDLTLRIAQQPGEWWDRPAEKVNADIAAWLRERDNQKDDFINKADEVQKQLVQRPAAASFGWTGDRLSVNAPTPLPPASLAQDFLDEVRMKALDLRDRLPTTNVAPRVRNSLNGVIAILPEQATDLRPGLLRSRARSLHADATAYAGQFQDGELPVDATAMLLDLSGGLRDLEGCFPELRDIEREIAALNLKPADVPAVQKHLEEINKVASASPAVTDNAKAVMAAGTETMKAEALPEIVEARTAEQALTSRNLVNAALQGSVQEILSRVPGTAGRVYDETERASLNVIRPVVSVGAAVAVGAGATLLVGGLVGPVAGLAVFGLAEYDRLPGIINFIKQARTALGFEDSDKK